MHKKKIDIKKGVEENVNTTKRFIVKKEVEKKMIVSCQEKKANEEDGNGFFDVGCIGV